jgi:hypothetical protein
MLRLMRRAIVAALAAMLVAGPGSAAAQQPPAEPWDGVNPFACTLQQLGTGTDFPQPDADPFCVEFDKTHQDVAGGGLADFVSKEPARVAAAAPKCFYFQRDHWTGSLVEGQSPELWHWDGSYFFDKASGRGGVYLENVRFGGQPADPTVFPGFPEELKPYFAGGRGGYQSTSLGQADPNCASKPNPTGPGGAPANGDGKCRVAGGRIGPGIAGLRLRASRTRARKLLGKPATESSSYATWCFEGGGRLAVVFRRERVRFLLTDARPFDARGVRIGMRVKRVLGRLHRDRRVQAHVWCARQRQRKLCFGGSHGRVAWLAVAPRGAKRPTLRRLLRAVPSAQAG